MSTRGRSRRGRGVGSNNTNAPSTSATPTSSSGPTVTPSSINSSVASSARRRGRGPARGLSRLRQGRLHCKIHQNRIILPPARSELKIIFESLFTGPWIHFHEIPDQVLDNAWALFKDLFSFDDDNIARAAMIAHVRNRWSEWMYRIRRPIFKKYESREQRIAHPPDHIDPTIWREMVARWMEESFQTSCSRNSINRGANRISHTSGSAPFAQHRHAVLVATGQEPDPIEMWRKLHTREDGQWSSEQAQQLYAQMEELKASSTSDGSTISMDSMSIYKEVMGKARSGIIRGYGMGPSPSEIFPSTSQRQTQREAQILTQQLQARVTELETNLDANVQEKVNQSLVELRAQLRAEIQAEMQANLEAQIQAAMCRMRDPPPLVNGAENQDGDEEGQE